MGEKRNEIWRGADHEDIMTLFVHPYRRRTLDEPTCLNIAKEIRVSTKRRFFYSYENKLTGAERKETMSIDPLYYRIPICELCGKEYIRRI